MLHTSSLLADALADRLMETFRRSYGKAAPPYAELIGEAARLVIERLSLSDALYHTAEHTALVTLVAQDILRGRRMRTDVPPEMWLHVILAALTHDIGYLRGVCRADTDYRFVVNARGEMIELPRGASDAALAPWHVDRGKIFVRERFIHNPLIDPDRLALNIELTRFPVPDGADHAATDTEAAFVRAADLIGQLGDPLYPKKLNALFHEFQEIGVNRMLGYTTPADTADHYPQFFWSKVEPFLGEAVHALNMTAEGRSWLANLYAHVCVIEHGRRAMGPNAARPPSEDAVIALRDIRKEAARSG
ncbi:metal-dependent phosphohydrolase [Reyranella sp.]|uniref:metal-dependent phosphohydrolase n=1 Tax=Reyranella sp. TaxID=1929291 RepID=UPI003784A659